MQPEPLIERDCKIEHEGRTYEAGGAFLAPCTDGYWRGMVYVGEECGRRLRTVTDWHGNVLATASLGPIYRRNFCRMQAVTFEWNGIKFHGRFCPDASESVRVRSTRKVGG
jgi:hypothetical protein